MAWVDYRYYKDEYLMGDSSDVDIPEQSFPRWEKQAETVINWRRITVDEPQNILKDCVCEVAEWLFSGKPEKEARSIISKHLRFTDYHNDFVHTGV